jgi:enoyl-[acyl-carrier-protein] reductase (NADH)
MVKNTPAGRMVQPEYVANVVAFLCDDASYMIRGQIIVIDGGVSLTSLGLNSISAGGAQNDSK